MQPEAPLLRCDAVERGIDCITEAPVADMGERQTQDRRLAQRSARLALVRAVPEAERRNMGGIEGPGPSITAARSRSARPASSRAWGSRSVPFNPRPTKAGAGMRTKGEVVMCGSPFL